MEGYYFIVYENNAVQIIKHDDNKYAVFFLNRRTPTFITSSDSIMYRISSGDLLGPSSLIEAIYSE